VWLWRREVLNNKLFAAELVKSVPEEVVGDKLLANELGKSEQVWSHGWQLLPCKLFGPQENINKSTCFSDDFLNPRFKSQFP